MPLGDLTDELLAKARGDSADRRWQVDAASPRSIVADRQRVTQAVMNLAQNAVAHTEAGDEIGIGARVNGDEARLWVRDTGTGIPVERAAADLLSLLPRRRTAAGATRAPASGSRSCARSPRPTAGGSGRQPPGAGARFEILLPIEQEAPRRIGSSRWAR